MRHSILLCKMALIGALASCGTGLPDAPAETTSQTASGPQELPAALRRVAYDVPDWGTAPSEPFVPPATATSAMDDAVPAPYQPQSGPSTRGPITASAAPVGLEIPSASGVRPGSYEPRADLSSFDAPVTTPGRAPRAKPQSETPAPPSWMPPEPTRAASAPADDFAGQTQSIMASATPTAPTAASSGRYGIHLASYRQPDNVGKGWIVLKNQHPDMLSGLHARGAPVRIPGKGNYIRLLVGPFSTPGDARLLCAHLKSIDEYCSVMPFDGTPVL